MEKSKLEVIANFLKKMKEKYPCDTDDDISVTLDNNMIIVYKVTSIPYESDWWEEMERFELE